MSRLELPETIPSRITYPDIKPERDELTARTIAFIDKYSQPNWEDPALVRSFLGDYSNWVRDTAFDGRHGYLARVRTSLELDNPKVVAEYKSSYEFNVANYSLVAPLIDGLSRLSNENVKAQLLQDNELITYHFFLNSLWESVEHSLPPAEEKIILLLGSSADFSRHLRDEFIRNTVRIKSLPNQPLNARQLKEILATSQDPKTTKSADRALSRIYARLSSTAGAELNSVLSTVHKVDKIEGYKSPLEKRNSQNGLKDEQVDLMIDTVQQSYPIAHRYFKLKAALFGYNKLPYAQRYRLPDVVSNQRKISYKDAAQLMVDVFSSVSPMFGNIVYQMICDGQVDSEPRHTKIAGASCYYGRSTDRPIITLQFRDDQDSVLSLAHELGHGIHHTLINQTQPELYCSSPSALSEIPSTFFEETTINYLRSSLDLHPSIQLKLLINLIDRRITSIFSQAASHDFESRLHAEFSTSPNIPVDQINTMFIDSMFHAHGDGVEYTKSVPMRWMDWTHLRRPFYNYSYAFAHMISIYISEQLKSDPTYSGKFKKLLSSGSSAPTTDILLHAGIDITKPQIWQTALSSISDQIDELERLIPENK